LSIMRLRHHLSNPLYRNSLYLISNSTILALTGFVFWTVAARLYPVDSVGLASAAISAMGVLALVATLGLDFALLRFLPDSGEQATDFVNSCLTIGGLLSLILSLAFIAGVGIWSPALLQIREHPVFLAAFAVFVLATTLVNFTRQTFVANRRADLALLQGMIFGVLRFVPLILMASAFTVFGIFASWGIAISLSVICAVLFLMPLVYRGYRPIPSMGRQVAREIVHFSAANYVSNLFWMAPGFILPLMVVNVLGAEPNAYFYIAWTIASVLFMVPVAISFTLLTEGAQFKKQLGEHVRMSLKLAYLLLIPAVIFLFLVGKWILLAFGTAYSVEGLHPLWVLGASSLPVAINQIYSSVLRVTGRLKELMVIWGLIAVVVLVASYLIMPHTGIIGIGYAWLGAQALFSAYVLIFPGVYCRRLSVSG